MHAHRYGEAEPPRVPAWELRRARLAAAAALRVPGQALAGERPANSSRSERPEARLSSRESRPAPRRPGGWGWIASVTVIRLATTGQVCCGRRPGATRAHRQR